jgi:pentatricopeptide repeat protein
VRAQGLEAEALVAEMHAQGIPPTPQCYTALTSALCRSGEMTKAVRVLERMRAAGLSAHAANATGVVVRQVRVDASLPHVGHILG